VSLAAGLGFFRWLGRKLVTCLTTGAALDLRDSTSTDAHARTTLLHLPTNCLPFSPETFTHVSLHACDWIADQSRCDNDWPRASRFHRLHPKQQPNELLRTFLLQQPRPQHRAPLTTRAVSSKGNTFLICCLPSALLSCFCS
jgi:hypothetical protein